MSLLSQSLSLYEWVTAATLGTPERVVFVARDAVERVDLRHLLADFIVRIARDLAQGIFDLGEAAKFVVGVLGALAGLGEQTQQVWPASAPCRVANQFSKSTIRRLGENKRRMERLR